MINQYQAISIEIAREAARRGQAFKLRVISDSMTPFLQAGDSVAAQAVDVNVLRRGDVIVFQREAELVTHRLIRVGQKLAQTKGDNRRIADEPIDSGAIMGRVNLIERAGRTIDRRRARHQRIDRAIGWLGWCQTSITPQRANSLGGRVIAFPFRYLIHLIFLFE